MRELAILALVGFAIPSPSAAQNAPLSDLVTGALSFHNEMSDHVLAELGRRQVEALIDGETVLVRRKARTDTGDELAWVYAYALSTLPRLQLWLAATRPGFSDDDELSTVGVERHDDGRTLTFMHLDTPWPLDDRWWLASVGMDVGLAEASGGRIWARRWRLAENGPRHARELAARGSLGRFTSEDLEDGLALPTNEGAYLTFDLDGRHTLIVYASLIAAGGNVPESFFTDFASRTLRRNVERILEEAQSVRDHYTHDAVVCTDGFGRPIPPFPDRSRPEAASRDER